MMSIGGFDHGLRRVFGDWLAKAAGEFLLEEFKALDMGSVIQSSRGVGKTRKWLRKTAGAAAAVNCMQVERSCVWELPKYIRWQPRGTSSPSRPAGRRDFRTPH